MRGASSGSLLPQNLVAELAESFVPSAEGSKVLATSATNQLSKTASSAKPKVK